MFLLFAPPGWALPSFRAVLDKHAGYKTSCRVCHQPSDNRLTSYAREYLRLDRGAAAFQALDVMDPDQDGFSSKKELALRANPGDPRSTPKHVGDWLANVPPAQVPIAPLTEIFGRTVEFDVREAPLTPQQIDRAQTFLKEKLRDEELQPTIFLIRQKTGGELVGYASYAFFGKNQVTSLLVTMLPGPILRDVRPLRVHGDQRFSKPEYLRQFESKTYDTLLGVVPPLGAEAQNAEILAAVRRAMKIAELVTEK